MTVRTAIIVPDSLHGRGGIERLMLYLSREWAKQAQGPRVMVAPTRLTGAPLSKHASSLPALIAFLFRARRFGVEVVHVNVAPRGSTFRKMLFARAGRIVGAKLVLHLHGSGYDVFYDSLPPALQNLVARFFRSADRVIVLGDHWQAFAADRLGLDERKIVLIDNGVPDPGPASAASGTQAHIVTLGLVGERKGTDTLLAALAALPQGVGAWRATIGGNGEVDAYRQMAADLGLAEKVTFTGWLGEGEVQSLLASATLFVLPSRAENQPVAILEAMARSLPVVSTRIGAIPEQVLDGKTGRLVPPGDSISLCDAISALLIDRDGARTMGAAGRKRYEERFSIAAAAKRIAAVYSDLVKET